MTKKLMNKQSIIIYFTSSGTTRKAADTLAQLTGAQAFAIQSTPPYPKSYEAVAKVGKTQLDAQTHPQLDKTTVPDISTFDRVYIGFPTWWQQPPMIIHSLFDELDFDDKTIIPFTTSMSTPMADSMPHMKKMAAAFNNTTVIDGIRYENERGLRDYLTQHHLI
ncbi:MAG TPA: flavodoxin [Lactobacillus sp.]|nr:flavodoxin [Lactobacillus sp.]